MPTVSTTLSLYTTGGTPTQYTVTTALGVAFPGSAYTETTPLAEGAVVVGADALALSEPVSTTSTAAVAGSDVVQRGEVVNLATPSALAGSGAVEVVETGALVTSEALAGNVASSLGDQFTELAALVSSEVLDGAVTMALGEAGALASLESLLGTGAADLLTQVALPGAEVLTATEAAIRAVVFQVRGELPDGTLGPISPSKIYYRNV